MRDLTRNLLVAVGLLAAIGIAVGTLGGNQKAIAQAQARAARLTTQRDSLPAVVRDRKQQQAALTIRVETHRAEASRLRDSVNALERRRAAAQLTVRQIRTVGALQDRLRAVFPELGPSGWGLTTVPLDGDTLGLEYLLVPAWFAETFVIDHANAESWRAQKDQLVAVDSLRVVVSALQDSILGLESAKAQAFEAGYRAAFSSYQDVSRRYLGELRKPRITLGRSIELLAAVGAGFLIARAVP